MANKKAVLPAIAVILALLLCACGSAGGVMAAGGQAAAPTQSQSPATPSPAPEKAPVSSGPALFRSYLESNYDAVLELCGGTVLGLAFIDLDMDGQDELLLLGSGDDADSFVYPVRLFDGVDGAVTYVDEESWDTQGARPELSVSGFEDFHLMRSQDDDQEFFMVLSFNGGLDFSFSELLRFGCRDGLLSLQSLAYKYDSIDADTRKVLSTRYMAAGADCSQQEYTDALSDFSASCKPLDYTVRAVRPADSPGYAQGLQGLLAMADAAAGLS